jgi:hypothetical protein
MVLSLVSGSALAQEVRVNVEAPPYERVPPPTTQVITTLTTSLKTYGISVGGTGAATMERSGSSGAHDSVIAAYAVSKYFESLVAGVPIIEKMDRIGNFR